MKDICAIKTPTIERNENKRGSVYSRILVFSTKHSRRLRVFLNNRESKARTVINVVFLRRTLASAMKCCQLKIFSRITMSEIRFRKLLISFSALNDETDATHYFLSAISQLFYRMLSLKGAFEYCCFAFYAPYMYTVRSNTMTKTRYSTRPI